MLLDRRFPFMVWDGEMAECVSHVRFCRHFGTQSGVEPRGCDPNPLTVAVQAGESGGGAVDLVWG